MVMTETSKPLTEVFAATAKKAEVATVDNGPYCHFNWDEVRGDPDNALFAVNWHDADCQEYSCAITEEAFDPENHPSLKDGIFRLLDSDGDPTEIRFYRLELLKPTGA
jgi:hypothetical protein